MQVKILTSTIRIEDVYTLGNLYVNNKNGNTDYINSIYGQYENNTDNINNDKVTINNAYYIQPENKSFTDLNNPSSTNNQHTKAIAYDDRKNGDNYTFSNNSDWRMYDEKTTPILNAFMPDAKDYFDKNNVDGIKNIQYGTAYDPLLTIINTNSDITLDWQKLGIYGDVGLAVYADENGNGGGLILNNFKNSNKGVGLFGGIIYSDGVLNINSAGDNIGLGNFSKIYGSSVTIDAGKTGTVDAYGSIISTGNKTQGDITITGGNVNTYGEIKTAVGNQETIIDGIKDTVSDKYNDKFIDIGNPNAKMPDVAEGYAHTVTAGVDNTGSVSISAINGDVNIYYGNMEKGIIDTQGNVSLSGNNVYVDSDMVIGGNLNATADSIGEIVVDISNIGKVSLKQYTDSLYEELVANNGSLDVDNIIDIINKLETKIDLDDDQLDAFANYLYETYVDENSNTLNSNATESAISDAIIKGRMHNFLHSFYKETGHAFNFKGTDNAKITVDLWNGSVFDLGKYDIGGHTLSTELSSLNITKTINNNTTELSGRDVTYIWVANGEQLKGIQTLAGTNSDVLNYNFALKNDINATDVSGYQAIGSGDKAFTGKFDGRGNRIIGLNVDNTNSSASHTSTDNVGVFGTIGQEGIVKNLKVYSSTFKGYDNVGAIAGTNNGTIDNVTTLGNTVEALGNANSVNVGAAGGVVGTNTGTVNNATSRDSVIAGEDTNSGGATTAGGIAGINTGLVSNSQSHSAVIASGSKDNTYSLGGIVGVNTASGEGLDNVNAYGVTGSSILVDNTGGIAGINKGTLHDAYNESIVKGSSNVGGITGTNSGNISLIVNGASVTAKGDYTGGLVGKTTGNISNGRNNGVITGVNYVGGLVGSNGNVILTNLTNDSSAEIIGEKYVGGIAGENNGNISNTEDTDGSKGTNLINRGSITGQNYVGGIAGKNNGIIKNVNNDIVLNVKDKSKTAEFFGGVTGRNEGTITNATNRGNINAIGATYVGGIAGENNGELNEFNGNYGNVNGGDKVGGAVGKNTVDINNAELVSAGTVKSDGGAGGIFAENSGDITNSDLSNNGAVEGDKNNPDSGTGGLIGINSGDIEKTSLRNEVNGEVSGVYNVGGLIGINSGTIVGGRDDADTYYKYQIYNNGTITATGTNSAHVGGLIGKNTSTGSLTAGYNTGVIDASNSSNVGGIVGNNEGIVKEVFNTIAGNGSVKGNVNVGGLIGTNSGTLSNAYSTSSVEGNVVGNVVGNNNKNSTVINVYATNTSGNLIGTNNGTINTSYSFSSSDDGKKGITYLETEADQKDKDNYSSSFDENTWKFYNGNANPLLKVFLTKAEFVPAKDKDGNNVEPNFVYNGNKQGVLISYNKNKNLVEVLDAEKTVIGTIKVADENAAHSLEDYINTIGQDNQLINGVQFIDAGTYEMLFSQQINTDGEKGNPNNLGFDFVTSLDNTNPNNDPPMITNDKAQINITLNDIERIYGSLDIINNGKYGFTYKINNGKLTTEMEKELESLGFSVNSDGALVKDKTNNVGNYTWNGTVTLDNSLLSNYEFTNKEGSITTTGNSKVTPRSLTLKDLLATIVYGNQDGKGLILSSDKNTDILNGIVYGDDVNINLGNITLGYKNDSAYDQNRDNRVTADVGTYENSLVVGNISLTNNEKGNYKLDTTTIGGSIQVTPASLTVGLNNVSHTYGTPNLNDYGVSSVTGLTNGDKANIGVTMTKDDALKDKEHTNDAGDYTWTGSVSGIEGLEKNYSITVNEGQSVVNKANLTIDLNDVEHTYGSPNLNDYGVNSVTGLTNGDKANIGVTMTEDTALKDESTHTNNAGGSYTWTGNISGLEGIENNYNITVNNGKSTVDKANLTIDLNDVEHTYGSPNLNDYGVSSVTGLTNGDKANIGVTMTEDTALKDENTHTNNAGDYTWTGSVNGIDGLEKNYSITVNKGQSVVNKADLVIDLGDVEHTYGTPNTDDYEIDNIGWANGDNYNPDNFIVGNVNDEAIIGKDKTQNANNEKNPNYKWTANVATDNDTINKNYNIIVNDGKSTVNKADLVVDLNKVYHTYGDPNLGDYGVSNVTGLTNGDKANIGVTMTKDNALKDNNMHTNNAGDYTWTGSVSGIEGLENNYNIKVNDGQSVVNKADLTIDLNENVHHEYGKPNLEDYKITGTEGLTNGDEAFEDKLDVTMTHDDALTDNNTHTKPAGEDYYDWTGDVNGIEGLENNYNITINPGKSTVDKGHLTITVDDSNTTVGDNPSYGGTIEGWTNGDNPDDFDISFGVDDDTVLDQPGKHDGVIGVIIGDKFYPSGTEDDIFNNYDVTINTGDLTVLKPFDIDDSKNWSHLYKDAPWDRNRDFKERKAEFNFVDGAIPLDGAVEEV